MAPRRGLATDGRGRGGRPGGTTPRRNGLGGVPPPRFSASRGLNLQFGGGVPAPPPGEVFRFTGSNQTTVSNTRPTIDATVFSGRDKENHISNSEVIVMKHEFFLQRIVYFLPDPDTKLDPDWPLKVKSDPDQNCYQDVEPNHKCFWCFFLRELNGSFFFSSYNNSKFLSGLLNRFSKKWEVCKFIVHVSGLVFQ